MNRLFNKAAQNVHGWERAVSVGGGLMLLGKGLRRGGVGGMVQIVMGGMAVFRGISGHSEAKRMLAETNEKAASMDQRYSHMPLDSEVHSPDFESPSVSMPDTTPMGHESHPDSRRGATS